MLSPKLKKYHHVFAFIFVAFMVIGGGVLNLKFIQLGIPALGRTLNLPELFIIISMFTLGASACTACIIMGRVLDKFQVNFDQKKVIFLLMSMFNTLFVFLTYFITDFLGYIIWIISLGLVLGTLAAIAYSFLFYLIPQKQRGIFAAILAGIMYLVSASSMEPWTFESFRYQNLIIWPANIVFVVFFLLFDVFDSEKIEENLKLEKKYDIDLSMFIMIFSFILFLDSFGFLRIIEDPTIVALTWQSTADFRLYIGIVHFCSALIIGFFYERLKPLNTILISLSLFVISDLMIGLFAFSQLVRYLYPLFYASAVSIYTFLLMSLLADISDENSLNKNITLGFGILGWFVTYTATSTSLFLNYINVSFNVHLIIAGIIAIPAIIIVLIYKKKNQGKAI
ncbi:MAG: hypothetical protein ACTSVY_07845 [Candidatus Helarchaeota archaeon]